jgi:plasmid replication initiation protein
MGLQNRLSQYGHFKNKVLKVAIAEINKHSEYMIDIEEHKRGRKITALSFEIKTKKKNKTRNFESQPSEQRILW